MSLFGSLGRLAHGALNAVRAAERVPVLGTAVRALPVVGTGLAAYDIASDIAGGFGGGGGGSGMPALPGGVPALPGAGAPAVVGDRSIFANDPNIAKALQAFAISKRNLKTAYRSPVKGYVVVRDSQGDPYALPKKLARQYAGWKPARKPPISAGEWHNLQRAERTAKKMRKVVHTMTRVQHDVHDGKVTIHKKKKG